VQCFGATTRAREITRLCPKGLLPTHLATWPCAAGSRIGFAVAFKLWQYQDGSVAMPGVPATRLADLPTAEALEAAIVAVHAQAEAIRALKHAGLGNSVRARSLCCTAP
jgi:hypothetical protein